jgi:hypothetical protein
MDAKFEKHTKEIMDGVTHETSAAYNAIMCALGDKYTEVMEVMEHHQHEKAQRGYERGFKDGVQFVMALATN